MVKLFVIVTWCDENVVKRKLVRYGASVSFSLGGNLEEMPSFGNGKVMDEITSSVPED